MSKRILGKNASYDKAELKREAAEQFPGTSNKYRRGQVDQASKGIKKDDKQR